MQNNFRRLLFGILLLAVITSSAALSFNVSASPNAQDSAWGEVVNNDGSINYGGMTDNGVVTVQNESFMPTIPFTGGQKVEAEYHVYTTESGNQVLMPTATTLFFMATDSNSALYTNPSMGTTPIGISGAESGQGNTLVGIAALGNLFSSDIQSGSSYDSSFFNSVIGGEQDIWQVLPSGIGDLFFSFMDTSLQDGSLYTYMIMIPPGACGSSPAGCTPEQLTLLTPPPPTEPPPTEVPPIDCPAPQVIPGKITFDGEKIAPNYPLVVGQDPDKRGVDFRFSASVAPTIYITYVRVADYECVDSPGASDNGCGPGQRSELTGYHCEKHSQSFDECIESAQGSARLTQTSREWILNELSVRYPEAYLHQPAFSFGSSSDCSWSDVVEEVQIADPGYWDLFVRGSTSGTPVSGPRSFGGKVDTFEAWLKEIAIIK